MRLRACRMSNSSDRFYWHPSGPARIHSCPNYEMRFAPEAGLMRVSWHSLFGNLFRACPSPFGRGWREAPGEGRKCTLIRPFGPPSPRGRRTRASISANLDTTGAGGVPRRMANLQLRALARVSADDLVTVLSEAQ